MILLPEQEWSDLADYYLALQYIVGMVDTDLSSEMNSVVGTQMMLSFMTLLRGLKGILSDMRLTVSLWSQVVI